MWGYLTDHPGTILPKRFIPTDVGLPSLKRRSGISFAIHPHGCGATPGAAVLAAGSGDSSPRMWGYPKLVCRDIQRARFIPTDVGLPLVPLGLAVEASIHPHGCGATWRLRVLANSVRDSSPRMWGYLKLVKEMIRDLRFIPTDVGLPISLDSAKRASSIHPHGCGATIIDR